MSRTIFSIISCWYMRRRMEGELLALSDRLLGDIGVDRGILHYAILRGRGIDLSDCAGH